MHMELLQVSLYPFSKLKNIEKEKRKNGREGEALYSACKLNLYDFQCGLMRVQ